MFTSTLSVEELCSWFIKELAKLGFLLDGKINQSKYDSAFSVCKNKQHFSFSIFENPSSETNLCIYVKPKLKFFDALRGKNDVLRELATNHTHVILSNSDQVSNLGWYTDKQVWTGPTHEP